jgi:hypothetical protein
MANKVIPFPSDQTSPEPPPVWVWRSHFTLSAGCDRYAIELTAEARPLRAQPAAVKQRGPRPSAASAQPSSEQRTETVQAEPGTAAIAPAMAQKGRGQKTAPARGRAGRGWGARRRGGIVAV